MRTDLLLELNAAFVKVAARYMQHRSESEVEYLHELERSVRECLRDPDPEGNESGR